MSVEVQIKTIVGCFVDKPLYETVKQRAFEHNYPEDWVYDPKTSEELWVNERKYLNEELEYGQVKDWQVFSVGDDYRAPNIIGKLLYKTKAFARQDKWSSYFITPVALARIRRQLQKDLTPLGLWDLKMFGIHSIREYC